MRETGYGSPLFLGVCRIAGACHWIEGTGPRATWRRLRAGSLWLTWYRLRLPRVKVPLTPSPAGQVIAEHLSIREGVRRKYRSAQGVLPLPDDFAEYLRGRHRQAVRTNVGHARRAGMTVASMAIDDWAPGEDDLRRPHITPGSIERWIVLDKDGVIVADSILSVDGDVALLHGLVASTTHARWLLHTAIVERLCGECGTLLINGEEAYSLGAGARHFQRLLGYEIARLRPTKPTRAHLGRSRPEPACLSWPPVPMSWQADALEIPGPTVTDLELEELLKPVVST
jgi:hypothetical protein